jgi:prepilin signal peptidase PulO-like enzyme (type II secretory pathway)
MRGPQDVDWNESCDPEIVDWKRVRSAIEHENMLTNQRFTWLLTSQGFLLGGFVLVFQASTKADARVGLEQLFQIVLSALALAGILVSLHLSRGILAAHEQHKRLEDWWVRRRKEDEDRHPPICGKEPRFLVTLHYHKFPVVFMIVWLILILAALYERLLAYGQEIGVILLGSVAAVGIGSIGFWLGRKKAVRLT